MTRRCSHPEVRAEMAKVCLEMADKCGEPPLSEQA